VERNKTVRRGDTYVQRAIGWALTNTYLLRAEAERPPRQTAPGQFVPMGMSEVVLARRAVVSLTPKKRW